MRVKVAVAPPAPPQPSDVEVKMRSIGLFWGPREMSAADCAQLLKTHFEMINQDYAAFGDWYPLGKGSNADNPSAVKVNIQSVDFLEKEIRKGVNRYSNNTVICELGYNKGWWNGKLNEGKGATLSVVLGGYSEFNSNSVVIVLPYNDPSIPLEEAFALRLMNALAAIWNPDFGQITFNNTDKIIKKEFG